MRKLEERRALARRPRRDQSDSVNNYAINDAGPTPVEIYWEQHGDPAGTPMLLVNGLGSPSASYQQGFVDEWTSRGFCITKFDNRDVGRSSRVIGSRPTERTYLLADMALDAIAVLDAVGWETAHVFGQSMGGMIVQQLIIDHPDRIRSMTSLMSTTGNPEVGRPSKEAMSALMATAPADKEGWLTNRVETEKIWASPEFYDPAAVRAKGELMWNHGKDVDGVFRPGVSPDGPGRQFKAIQASGPRDDALREATTPSLVLHGSADTLVGPDGGRHTAEVIPGARYVEIEGMGHDLPEALWPRLVDKVASFVAGL